MGRPYVVVVGGANVDISGRPSARLVPHDSNLGAVRLAHGGVGRNIAHNLALLDVDVRLVTAFGDDALAEGLKAGCREAGIDVSASLDVAGGNTSTYLYVTDEQGEMEVAINDMAIVDRVTPEAMAERRALLDGAAAVVMETNLPHETLLWLADNVASPLFCDPISTLKARKLKGVLPKLHTLKPNRLEAQELTGIPVDDEWSLSSACDNLLGTGLARAFVSLGAEGLLCAEQGRSVRLQRVEGELRNATGAGDAMMAAIVWAHLQGLDLVEAGKAGLAASSIAIEADQAVSPCMCEGLLKERMAAQP